jgi:hypothetical protein
MIVTIARPIITCMFVLLLVVGIGLAEEMQAYIDEPTTIVTACIRNSQMRQNATVGIIIYDSTGSTLVAANSTPAGDGTFSYAYTFTQIGSYSTKETCDFGDYLADGSTSINVVKPTFGSMQVIAQGVAEVDIDKLVRSEWLLLMPNVTNSSQSSIIVEGGSCGVSDINGLAMNITPDVTITNSALAVAFIANETLGFEEGSNYEILCNITLSQGLAVNGIKNFVYINPHMTYWQFLTDILSTLMGISDTTNQTLQISNQTLQIVSSMNTTNTNSTEQLLEILMDDRMTVVG